MNSTVRNLLFAIFFIVIMSACTDDQKEVIITDFSESKSITVIPHSAFTYTTMNVWVKGTTNDTILVKLHSKKSTPILKLSGEFNERWYTDYYGEGERTVIFEPYKASKGKLEIRVEL